MEQLVVVRSTGPGCFTAQVVGIPEIKAVGDTEERAVEEARRALQGWLGAGKLVPIQLAATRTGNPWIDYAGRSADDPTFPAFLEELERARAADTIE